MVCILPYFYLQIVFIMIPTLKGNDCNGLYPVSVTVRQGKMMGSSMMTENSTYFCAFLGIPYAEPPVGHLRFRAPQPAKPWRGILSATTDAEACIQLSNIFSGVLGSEDCLYLNVYTPQMKPSDGTLQAVVIWFHGGDFLQGSAGFKQSNPSYFVDRNVVVVTPSYRLGALGFLSTGDDESPGNYGLKDQVAAMHWVHDNIEAFGGNPKRVTILGHGAGGVSVHYHMLSPMTLGLFHRAISMEGTAFVPWARTNNPLEVAQKQAHFIGCPTEPSSSLVECMRQLPADEIIRNVAKMFVIWLAPSSGFMPVMEKKSKRNSKPYLTEDPLNLVQNGSFQQVPWLMGNTNSGLTAQLSMFFTVEFLRGQLNASCHELTPKLLMLPVSMKTDLIPDTMKRIEQFYGVNSSYLYEYQASKWIEIYADRFFIHGTHKAALLHSAAGHWPIYKYNFAYKGLVIAPVCLATLQNLGICHGEEMRYISPLKGELLSMGTNDMEVQKVMTTLWTNFIKHGNPTPPKLGNTIDSNGLLETLTWEPIGEIINKNVHLRYFNIGQVESSSVPSMYLNQFLGPVRLNMAHDLFKDRMKFWDSLPLGENVPGSVYEKLESDSSDIHPYMITTIALLLLGILLMQGFQV